MDAKILVDSAREAGYKVRSYSGRNMMGRTCVGIVVERNSSEFQVCAGICKAMMEEVEEDELLFTAIHNLADLSTNRDNLGLDTILYFPELPWSEDLEDEE